MAAGRPIYRRGRACDPAPALRALLDPRAAAASGETRHRRAVQGPVHAGHGDPRDLSRRRRQLAQPRRSPASDGDDWIHIESGQPVTPGRIEKMSKSKRNTIDPEPILAKYGADAVRWFMLSDSPPERDLEWSEAGIEGAARFVQRVWRLASGERDGEGEDEALKRKLHRDDRRGRRSDRGAAVQQGGRAALRAGQRDREGAAVGDARRGDAHAGPADRADGAAPRRGSLGGARRGRAWSPMPPGRRFDPALLVDDQVTLAVQVNGKLRDTLTAPRGLDRGRGRSARAGVGQGPAPARRRSPAQGDCGSRPAGEYRRMMRRVALLARCCWRLPAAGFSRSTAAAAASPVAATLRSVQVAPIAGQSGWLVRNKLVDRLGESRQRRRRATGSTSRSTTISPRFGIRGDRAATRERRTLRARYQLVDLANGDGGARRDRRIRRRHRRRQLRICDGRRRADRARATCPTSSPTRSSPGLRSTRARTAPAK